MRPFVATVLLCGLMFAACEAGNESKDPTTVQEFDTAIARIEQIMSRSDSIIPDEKVANRAIFLYHDFARRFPEDPQTPEYLWRAARINLALNRVQNAITYLKRIIKNYKNYDKIADVTFMCGFIYEDRMDRLGEAKTYYQMVVDQYPESPFADDAKASIRNLGMSDEALIEFLKSGGADSMAATQ